MKVIVILLIMLIGISLSAQTITFKEDRLNDRVKIYRDDVYIGYCERDHDQLNFYSPMNRFVGSVSIDEYKRNPLDFKDLTFTDKLTPVKTDNGVTISDLVGKISEKKRQSAPPPPATKPQPEPTRVYFPDSGYKERDPVREDIWNVFNRDKKQVGYYKRDPKTRHWDWFDGIPQK